LLWLVAAWGDVKIVHKPVKVVLALHKQSSVNCIYYFPYVITYSRDYSGINTLLLLSLHIKYAVMEGWGK
jgi:hypothetical protein